MYFEGFLAGFDALYPKPIRDIVGPDHDRLRTRLDYANVYRNKIFHGQLTEDRLKRSDLEELVRDIRLWCCCLAQGAAGEFGYDGFQRDSFQKSSQPALWERYVVQIQSPAEYDSFIKKYMVRA